MYDHRVFSQFDQGFAECFYLLQVFHICLSGSPSRRAVAEGAQIVGQRFLGQVFKEGLVFLRALVHALQIAIFEKSELQGVKCAAIILSAGLAILLGNLEFLGQADAAQVSFVKKALFSNMRVAALR